MNELNDEKMQALLEGNLQMPPGESKQDMDTAFEAYRVLFEALKENPGLAGQPAISVSVIAQLRREQDRRKDLWLSLIAAAAIITGIVASYFFLKLVEGESALLLKSFVVRYGRVILF